MAHLIYNKETTYILINRRTRKEQYSSERTAKAALTRMQADADNGGKPFDRDEYAIAEVADFHNNIEKSVERRNLMTGEKFMERINTPSYCSPACESYYTM